MAEWENKGSDAESKHLVKDALEESLRLAHGGLEVERLNVLPLLLEEGDEEVDGQHGVGHNLVLVHVDVTDGDSETEDLLKLELDGALDLGDLLAEVVRVGDGGGELTGLGETGAEQTGDLLDQGLGSEESIVLLGELLDELLVLVELLQILDSHVLELNLLGLIDVGSIGKNAYGHSGSGNVGELDGTRLYVAKRKVTRKITSVFSPYTKTESSYGTSSCPYVQLPNLGIYPQQLLSTPVNFEILTNRLSRWGS